MIRCFVLIVKTNKEDDMAADKKLTVTLENPQEKKHVTRYDANDEDAAMSSVYINKAALKKLGNPAKVKVTIEVA